jgi:hypothetical protein
MSTASMIRDWTYVAVVALLLASYGYSLLAKGFAAHAAEDNGVRVCVLSDASAVKTN